MPRLAHVKENSVSTSSLSKIEVNGVGLLVAESGAGEPLVLVHGSWVDRRSWSLVEEELARSFHVFSYDRRGHSGSDDGVQPGSRREDEEDLAGLIEAIGLGPVHIAANSFGTSVALGTAARRPDLVRSVCGHEPPLVALIAGDPAVAQLDEAFRTVVGMIDSGDHETAARTFAELVVGPGAWELLPADERAAMVQNARTFAGECRQPDAMTIDLDALAAAGRPVMLTRGDASPPFFRDIVGSVGEAVPDVQVETFAGAGHVPHRTHPEQWVSVVTGWAARG
jgi:pimeloyl-ACP methyl ester carboxylesterase